MGISGSVLDVLRLLILTLRRIWSQIGSGERIALSKLAVTHFEKHGRPLRIAVDASIWHYQTQSGKGGSNPELRTLYYRLLRLLSFCIQPLFVFDGSNKPPSKRGAKTGSQTAAMLPNFITKQVLQYFGFPYHTAPGEAEAECALLQKEGIVDAVLSEDVDTIMFGCTVHLRNWSSENVRGNKVPTHVNMYVTEATKANSGLDGEGMVLVALMSGGDYIPAGIPGCGIKIACEAAKAGFGSDLCRIPRKDTVSFNQWRERLQYELEFNESGYFRTRHKRLEIPENFPDKKVLGYYTHPAVSSAAQLDRLREQIVWDKEVDIQGLRYFVAEAFEWTNQGGAKKFVRSLAPAILIDRLRRRYPSVDEKDDLDAKELDEAKLVTAIGDQRSHFITDGTPELRLTYMPIDIVGLDLQAEHADEQLEDLPIDSDNENSVAEEDEACRSRSPQKRGPSKYDPTQPERIWVMKTFAQIGIPLMLETWEEDRLNPKKVATRKARERADVSKVKRKPTTGGMKEGAMNAFVKTTKPNVNRGKTIVDEVIPTFLAPAIAETVNVSPRKSRSRAHVTKPVPSASQSVLSTPVMKSTTKVFRPSKAWQESPGNPCSFQIETNPWTLSKRPSDTLNVKLTPGTKYSALGICESSSGENAQLARKESAPQLQTPPSPKCTPKRSVVNVEEQELPQPSTSRPVNRKLKFDPQANVSTSLSAPSSPDLLLSSQLMSPPPEEFITNASQGLPTSSSRHQKPLITTIPKSKSRALVALRASLDGTWRDIEPWETKKGYIKTLFTEVETVDMTNI